MVENRCLCLLRKDREKAHMVGTRSLELQLRFTMSTESLRKLNRTALTNQKTYSSCAVRPTFPRLAKLWKARPREDPRGGSKIFETQDVPRSTQLLAKPRTSSTPAAPPTGVGPFDGIKLSKYKKMVQNMKNKNKCNIATEYLRLEYNTIVI